MSSFEPFPGWHGRRDFSAERPAGPRFQAEPPTGAAQGTEAGVAGAMADPVEEGIRKAYEEGLAAGRAEPCDEGRTRALQTLEAAAREILELRNAALVAQRREIVDLALAIAGSILGRPLADDADALAERVGLALSRMERSAPLSLGLAPQDHALVTSDGASALARILQGRSLELAEDPELAPGEFRLEAGAAEADGRRSVLLADLRARLLEAAGAEGP